MKLHCSNCGSVIAPENINIATDLAQCAECGEVHRASDLAAEIELQGSLTPPAGSGITVDIGEKNTGEIAIPKRGAGGGDVYALIFSGIWICMTLGMSFFGIQEGPLLFAIIPALMSLFGFAILRGTLIGITERQTIRIEPDAFCICNQSLMTSRKIDILYTDIESIDIQPLAIRDPFAMMRYAKKMNQFGSVPLATITHGANKTHVGENVGEAETKWLIKILKSIVLKQTGRRT